eukprot:940326-Prorocentrum_minimum.AAC.4
MADVNNKHVLQELIGRLYLPIRAERVLTNSPGLSFTEFVEAVCRLADVISPPHGEELDHFFRFNDKLANAECKFYHYVMNLFGSRQLERRRIPLRGSHHFAAPNTRPLAEKLTQILDLIQVCPTRARSRRSYTNVTPPGRRRAAMLHK